MLVLLLIADPVVKEPNRKVYNHNNGSNHTAQYKHRHANTQANNPPTMKERIKDKTPMFTPFFVTSTSFMYL